MTFRPFTKEDWFAFSGCEHPDPLIHDVPGSDISVTSTVIIDGDIISVFWFDEDSNYAWTSKPQGEHIMPFAEYVARQACRLLQDPEALHDVLTSAGFTRAY